MAAQINLLPKEKEVSKGVQKASNFLNKIALVMTVIFLLIVIAGGTTYYFVSRRVNTLKEDQQRYTNNIQSLQTTEASLILLKDRLQKAQNILSSRVAENSFAKQQQVLSFNPEAIVIEGSEIDNSKSILELVVPNSEDLLVLFSNLYAQNNFSNLIVNELSFSSFSGYTVELNVN